MTNKQIIERERQSVLKENGPATLHEWERRRSAGEEVGIDFNNDNGINGFAITGSDGFWFSQTKTKKSAVRLARTLGLKIKENSNAKMPR